MRALEQCVRVVYGAIWMMNARHEGHLFGSQAFEIRNFIRNLLTDPKP